MSLQIRITEDETGEAEVCEFAQFLRDNPDVDDDEAAEMERTLRAGGIYSMGGGAAPLYLITVQS